ncbi:MAG TPA: transposase [Spongiibacteraceae bacterium]|nr:transposase [Spongiibacteraceae bacterium]
MGKPRAKSNPERTRMRYSREFKLEAIRLLESGQMPVAQLALQLGVARNKLYQWRDQLRKSGETEAFSGSGRRPLQDRSEVDRLREALKRVTEERDILKKAAAYFARELP